jgi:hypothetical protein
MFTIKLTKGQGWEAPVIKEWKVPVRSLPDAELFARALGSKKSARKAARMCQTDTSSWTSRVSG